MNNASNSAPLPPSDGVGPTGLSGWLALLMTSLVLVCLYLSYRLAFEDIAAIKIFAEKGDTTFVAVTIFRAIAETAIITLGVSIVDAYFSRHRNFQKYFIAWFVVLLLSTIVWESYFVLASEGYIRFKYAKAAFAYTCVGVCYLLTARRVRNTFS